MARLHSCNVLESTGDHRRLWQFSAAGNKFNLLRDEKKGATEPLPPKLAAKDWQILFQPRLNVAWLPADKVFLRAVQLPKADFAEMQSMVELQLEKLSPLPVNQVAWTFELFPHTDPGMQTVVVIVVPRAVVEEHLGQLESAQYLTDRLELPLLDQLRATEMNENGVWIYPDPGAANACLVAWWYDGVLQNVTLLHLPAGPQRGGLLQNQLAQMVWAGEMEGWLTSTPRYHLVADETTAAIWQGWLSTDQPVAVIPPARLPELAAMTARRAASADTRVNLLPPEYTARYKQQFVDRLWMRSLGAMLMMYIMGVLIYFALVQFANWQLGRVESKVVELGPAYTNALQLKEQVKVLQDQVDLQFAALDCYKAVADFMPAELQLNNLNLDRGHKLTLSGTSPAGQEGVAKVQEFNDAMRQAMDRSGKQPLFTRVNPPNTSLMPGSQVNNWTFNCELKRTDN